MAIFAVLHHDRVGIEEVVDQTLDSDKFRSVRHTHPTKRTKVLEQKLDWGKLQTSETPCRESSFGWLCKSGYKFQVDEIPAPSLWSKCGISGQWPARPPPPACKWEVLKSAFVD